MSNKFFEWKYCTTCGEYVQYVRLTKVHLIAKNFTVDGPSDYDECKGPFTNEEPPSKIFVRYKKKEPK